MTLIGNNATLCIALIIISLSARGNNFLSSSFIKTYSGSGNDEATAVYQTTDSGFLVAGCSAYLGKDTNVYLIRTNTSGDTLWTKNYGNKSYDFAYDMKPTTDSGFIIVGQTRLPTGKYIYILRIDKRGDTLWTKTFVKGLGNEGRSVQQTFDGGYIIGGFYTPLDAPLQDGLLIRTDSKGDTLWTKSYGGERNDNFKSIYQTKDSGFICVGSTNSFDVKTDNIFIVCTDKFGNERWTKTTNYSTPCGASCVIQAINEGFVIGGNIRSWGPNDDDAFVMRTTITGELLWFKKYGGGWHDHALSICECKDSGFVFCGYTESLEKSYDVYLVKTNIRGDTLWTKTFGGKYNESGYAVQQNKDGGFVVAGKTNSFSAGDNDVLLIKTKADGEVAINTKIPFLPQKNSTVLLKAVYRKTSFIFSFSKEITGDISSSLFDLHGKLIAASPRDFFMFGRKEWVWNLQAPVLKQHLIAKGSYIIRINLSNQIISTVVILRD